MLKLPSASATSHAQPEPKTPIAAAVNSFLNSATLPKAVSSFAKRAPVGAVSKEGVRLSQNNVWLACPPRHCF